MTVREIHAISDRALQLDETAGHQSLALEELWRQMSDLTARPQRPARLIDAPVLGFMQGLVRTALLARGGGGKRKVPSAGAIYPYTPVIVAPVAGRNGAEYRFFQVNALDAPLARLDIDSDVASHPALTGFAGADPSSAYIMLMSRPWLSVRKYGLRGYMYAQLDAGHAATNLLGVALETSNARLELSIAGGALEEVLTKHFPYHELHSILTVDDCPPDPAPPVAVISESRSSERQNRALDFEPEAWRTMRELFSSSASDQVEQLANVTVVRTRMGAIPPSGFMSDWSINSDRRRSSQSFEPGAIDGDDLLEMVRSLAVALPIDLVGGGSGDVPSVMLVLPPGVLSQQLASRLSEYVTVFEMVELQDKARIVNWCMGQHHVAGAAGFLLVHAGRSNLVSPSSPGSLRRALFCAAAAAHLVHLGAASVSLGVSTIGGFDTAAWRAACRLPEGEDLLCLVAIGQADETDPTFIRRDQEARAHAHGE